MRFNEVIALRSFTTTRDEYGEPINTPIEKEVYADKKSVTRSEFYSALTGGINASIVFVIRSEDYDDQTEVAFNSKPYNVIRTFQKGEGFIELVCKAV